MEDNGRRKAAAVGASLSRALFPPVCFSLSFIFCAVFRLMAHRNLEIRVAGWLAQGDWKRDGKASKAKQELDIKKKRFFFVPPTVFLFFLSKRLSSPQTTRNATD